MDSMFFKEVLSVSSPAFSPRCPRMWTSWWWRPQSWSLQHVSFLPEAFTVSHTQIKKTVEGIRIWFMHVLYAVRNVTVCGDTAVHQQAVHRASVTWIFTHLYTCACTRTHTCTCTHIHGPNWQLGQLTALARSRVFIQSHLFLHCLLSLGNAQFMHSSTVSVNTSPGLHLPFSLITQPLLWVLFCQTATSSSPEAFEPMIQQLPPVFFFFICSIMLYWFCIGWCWGRIHKQKTDRGTGLDHMVDS